MNALTRFFVMIREIFFNRRMAVVLLTGFSGGLPLALTGSTLQAWMTVEGVDLKTIGIFALAGLPYTLKIAWSPLIDRYVPPFLGRRRGWLMISQVLLAAAIAAMGFSNPSGAPVVLAVLAVLTSFFSASQDIVIDAYRTEILKKEEYGAGAGLYIMGYRIAMLVSGAMALILATYASWKSVYLFMAGLMLIGVIGTLLAPEPQVRAAPPKNLREAFIEPLFEYFERRGAIEILVFIVLYKLGDVIAAGMTTPFMIRGLGFTTADIGYVVKTFGLFATIIGTLIGGAIIARIGIRSSLFFFGILQAASNLMFMILAQVGHNYPVMVSAIAIENLSGGMGTAAFSAFMMSLCNQRFTATQYALLTSLMAVTRVIAGAPTGFMAENLGWEQYFLASTLMAFPGLLMIVRYNRWVQDPKDGAVQSDPAAQPVN